MSVLRHETSPGPSRALRTLAVAVLAAIASCGRGAPISEETKEIGRAAAPSKPSPEAAAHAAWAGPRVFDIPLYPGADEAAILMEAMRPVYRPFADHVLMDQAIENRGHHHSQRPFTAIATAPNGTLVKLTISRPFLPLPRSASHRSHRDPDRSRREEDLSSTELRAGILFATVIVACRGEPIREKEPDEVAAFPAAHRERPVPLQGTPPQGPGWIALTLDLEPGSRAAGHQSCSAECGGSATKGEWT